MTGNRLAVVGLALAVGVMFTSGTAGVAEAAKPTGSQAVSNHRETSAGTTKSSAVTKVAVGWYWITAVDPDCPDADGVFTRWTRYNDENDEFLGDEYSGHSTYGCGAYYKYATFEQPWYDCYNSTYGCYQIAP